MRRILSSRAAFRAVFGLVVILVALFVCERLLLLPLGITTPSMQPSLQRGDRILVVRSHASDAELRKQLRRGDVIVFRAPQPGKPLLVKRVIGLPGELIQAKDGVVAIDNSTILEEDWLPHRERDLGTIAARSVDIPRTRIADDEVFLMGDNREFSIDSRSFGPVGLGAIVGRSAIRIWPPNRLGRLDWS
jgi:signal peptidase I